MGCIFFPHLGLIINAWPCGRRWSVMEMCAGQCKAILKAVPLSSRDASVVRQKLAIQLLRMTANAHFFPHLRCTYKKKLKCCCFVLFGGFWRRGLVMPDEAGTRLSRGPRVEITSWRPCSRTTLARFSAGEMFGLPTRREFVHVLMTDKQRRQPMQIRCWYQS